MFLNTGLYFETFYYISEIVGLKNIFFSFFCNILFNYCRDHYFTLMKFVQITLFLQIKLIYILIEYCNYDTKKQLNNIF